MPQTMKRLVPFLCSAVLMCAAATALAQRPSQDDFPKVEVFAGCSVLGDQNKNEISFTNDLRVTGKYASTTGFETFVARNFNRHLGLKFDFSAHFNSDSGRGTVTVCNPVCVSATQDMQLKTRVYNFLAGPEFKARNHTRLTPFVYALGGVAHTSAQFSTPGPTFTLLLKKSNNDFAMALGGGLEIRVSKRASFRGSIDYNPIFIGDSTGGTRDLVRFSLGVLFH